MREITSWDLPERAGWQAWRPGTGAAETDRIVAELAATPSARDRLRQSITAADEALSAPACVMVALWVPDPNRGEAVGELDVTLIGAEPGRLLEVEEIAAGLARPPKVRGTKVLHHDMAQTEVEAGAVVIVTRTVAMRLTRQVIVSVEWTVVPPDSSDGMHLVFSTPFSAIAERLADESSAIVNSLRLELGQ